MNSEAVTSSVTYKSVSECRIPQIGVQNCTCGPCSVLPQQRKFVDDLGYCYGWSKEEKYWKNKEVEQKRGQYMSRKKLQDYDPPVNSSCYFIFHYFCFLFTSLNLLQTIQRSTSHKCISFNYVHARRPPTTNSKPLSSLLRSRTQTTPPATLHCDSQRPPAPSENTPSKNIQHPHKHPADVIQPKLAMHAESFRFEPEVVSQGKKMDGIVCDSKLRQTNCLHMSSTSKEIKHPSTHQSLSLSLGGVCFLLLPDGT